MTSPRIEPHVTVRELAERLQLRPTHIYAAIQSGALLARRFSPKGQLRIPQSAVDRWLASHEITPPAQEAAPVRARRASRPAAMRPAFTCTPRPTLDDILPPPEERVFSR